jgi:hypothetical protein
MSETQPGPGPVERRLTQTDSATPLPKDRNEADAATTVAYLHERQVDHKMNKQREPSKKHTHINNNKTTTKQER